MYTLKKINKLLLKSDEQDLDEYFVSAACQINEEGEAKHAGIVIHCEEGYYLFHYGGEDVELCNALDDEWYFQKSFDFILPDFCGEFLGHCKKIKENSNPKYGFFYQGSYYEDGKYYSENGLPEYMTCVGFCINVIKGFIEADEYFQYTDWTNEHINEGYINHMVEKMRLINPKINPEHIKENIRRISPPEFIASAFLDEIPIRRANVNEIIELVIEAINMKR